MPFARTLGLPYIAGKSALDRLDLLSGVNAFELVEIGSGIERGATDEAEGCVNHLCAAFGIKLNGAFTAAADGSGGCDEALGRQVAIFATCFAPVLRLGVQFFVNRLAPCCLAGTVCRARNQSGTSGEPDINYSPPTLGQGP